MNIINSEENLINISSLTMGNIIMQNVSVIHFYTLFGIKICKIKYKDKIK